MWRNRMTRWVALLLAATTLGGLGVPLTASLAQAAGTSPFAGIAPGSAWKPVLYGAALVDGAITAGTPLRDAPIADYDEATGVHWKPRSGDRFRGVALAPQM